MFGLLRKSAAAKGRIGVAFENDRVAIAVAAGSGDRVLLQRCEVVAFDPAGGLDAAAAAIRSANLPRMPVSIVLRPEDYQLVLVEAPDVPPAELRAAMRWRLRDSIDFRVEDAVIDVFDVPPQSRGGVGRMMYAVAARRAAVERCAAALAAAPLFDVVDVPELCLRNLASRMPEAGGGVALLHLGETSASVILVRGTTYYFSRQTELRPAQAVRPDAAFSMYTDAGADPAKADAATDAAQLDSDAIVLELQRSLDYYERHFDQPPISRIAISPFGDRSLALAEALNRDTGFHVSALDLNALLGFEAPVDASAQAACLMAVGAAIREERRTL